MLGNASVDLYLQGKASEDWQPISADVEHFQYSRDAATGNRNDSNVANPDFDIVYHYVYDGTRYRGDLIGFGPYSKGQLTRPENGQITVHFDPEDPSKSVYIKGVSKPNLGALAVSIGLGLIGLIFIYVGWRRILSRK